MIKVIDISRPIHAREPVYPGNVRPKLSWIKTFKRDGSSLAALSFGLHTATHLDAPFHYLKHGRTVDRIHLEQCLGWARVIDMKSANEIGEKEITRIRPMAGEIILLKTKNSRVASRKFNPKFAHINELAAKALIVARVKAVGIDGPSIRRFRLRPDTIHPMLLRAGILIYEGLDLRATTPGRYYFFGMPLNITGAEASPVRAVLVKS